MKVYPIRTLIIILTLGLVGVSCNDTSTGTGGPDGERVTFQGRVENNSSNSSASNNSTDESVSAIEGAVVTAARVKADGSLETIGSNQVQTNAQGQYSLTVDISSATDVANRTVIVAEKSGETAKTFVGAEVVDGSTITVQPITFESSAEADVFQNVVANGNTDIVAKADIEAKIEDDVAADIESNAQNAATIASALASSAEAKAQFYAEKGIEISEDQRQQIAQIKQNAQVQLANDLSAATNTEEKQAALDTFLETVANAEMEAGVEAWAVAQSYDFAARMLVKQSAELSSDAQAELRKQAYYYAAVAIDAAVQAQLTALEASQATIDAVADAGATLQSEVQSTTNGSKEAIDEFFVQFNEDVQAAVNNDTSLNGSAFVSANTAISGSADLKSTLESTLSASSSISTMLSAYADFSSGVQSIVDSNFTDAGDAEAQAYTRILVLINIAS